MAIRICACGKEYVPTLGVTKCEECLQKDAEEQQKVKEYVEEHPGVTVVEVSRLFDISPSRVRQMIRDNVIQFSDQSVIKMACEKCGCPIIGGRFCDECSHTLSQGEMLRSKFANNRRDGGLVVDESCREKQKGKMRFFEV